MPIALIDKAVALLTAIDANSLENAPPAERRRLADICRHIAAVAEPKPAEPKAGVLFDLKNGKGRQ
jgi:hypothetical protein